MSYSELRGRCKELSEAACAADPSLTLIRGHYYCPIWNRDESHWWTVRKDGIIYDPTKSQYPSNGMGIYTPFDGICTCSECGKEVAEKDAYFESNYVFCSGHCFRRFVGI